MTLTAKEAPVRSGVVRVKASKLDPVYSTFRVREWESGVVEYDNHSVGKWCELPAAWAGKIEWDGTKD